MRDPRPCILWDFDGTLAERPGLWSGCMVEALDAYAPGHGIRREALIPHLRAGFPWHTPQIAHPELASADTWWARLEPVLARCYERVGLDPDRARMLGRRVRVHYLETSRWRVFDETPLVLRQLREQGWRHAILSNHVPELDHLVAALGLGGLIDHTINSARTGYEKPHPEAFAIARQTVGDPKSLWMVGDSMAADIRGAEREELPAILVRRDGTREPGVTWQATDLWGVEAILRAA